MSDNISYKIVTKGELDNIALLAIQLNPKLSFDQAKEYLMQMFEMETYICFGVYMNGKLIGISGAWTTVRLYSGKQLEVDNVIIDQAFQSQGIGKQFFGFIENWAKNNDYQTIELNTYVQNAKSHKFYFNLGFSILGFHFWKRI